MKISKFALVVLSLTLTAAPLMWADAKQESQTTTPTAPVSSAESAKANAEAKKQPAKFLSGADPEYSESAREKQIEGTVILAVKVNEKGKVTSVKVINPLESSLDRRAAKAVKHWKFAPATVDGKAVPSEFNVSVDFRLAR